MERRICTAVLKQLDDNSNDVQTIAVKCLGALLRKVQEAQVRFALSLCGVLLLLWMQKYSYCFCLVWSRRTQKSRSKGVPEAAVSACWRRRSMVDAERSSMVDAERLSIHD